QLTAEGVLRAGLGPDRGGPAGVLPEAVGVPGEQLGENGVLLGAGDQRGGRLAQGRGPGVHDAVGEGGHRADQSAGARAGGAQPGTDGPGDLVGGVPGGGEEERGTRSEERRGGEGGREGWGGA